MAAPASQSPSTVRNFFTIPAGPGGLSLRLAGGRPPRSMCVPISLTAAFLIAPMAAPRAHAQTSGLYSRLSDEASCQALELHEARGVPNEPEHRYAWKGMCRVREGGKLETVRVDALGTWDGRTSEAHEALELEGDRGSVEAVFRCKDDPWLAYAREAGKGPAPGQEDPYARLAVRCTTLRHDNSTGIGAFSRSARSHLPMPITVGRVSAARAEKLSRSGPAPGRTRPPPGRAPGRSTER
ncbi:MAG: hypothetical protein ACE5JR_06300 [Gemmatimonadota bacterium]